MQTDMTVGKPMKMILDFTIPVFIGNVFQQFYRFGDRVGHHGYGCRHLGDQVLEGKHQQAAKQDRQTFHDQRIFTE